MSGPEHYREAERLLDIEAAIPAASDETNPAAMQTIAEAQVHATLALAAATALNDNEGGSPRDEWHTWRVAAGYPAKADRDFVASQAAIEAGEARPR